MSKIKYLIVLISFWGLQGCDNYLDIKPKGYTIPEYFDDYVKLMNSDLFNFTAEVYTAYMTDDVHLGNQGDLRTLTFDSKNDEEKNLYGFKSGQVFMPGQTDRFWNGCYERLFTLNAVINNVGQVADAPENEKNRLIAEAKVVRAFEYLNLINGYATHYNAATASTDLGVPLILSEDINQSYSRNSVAEVYAQIEKDLTQAAPHLSKKVPHLYRPTEIVVNALLARMYLYMGKYDDALIYSRKVLAENDKLIDSKIYRTQKGTWTRIYNPNITNVSDPAYKYPQTKYSEESIFLRRSRYSINFVLCASEDLVQAYKKDLPGNAIDQRYSLMFAEDSINRGRNYEYFKGLTTYAPYLDFNLGVSTPEMYLINAECEARVGDKDEAMRLIKVLRDNRIIGNTELSAASKDEALRIVVDERRRELAFIGLFRIIDLKRLNRDDRFKKDITHTADGETWTLPANDNRYILPVPNTVLEHNPDMPQYKR